MPTLNINDLEIHYSERGTGPTVLALHAATSSGFELGWLAHHISKQGYHVVTPDQRGHGQTLNPASDLRLPRLVDDALGFIDQLSETPIHAAGYSLGGGVALYAARRRSDLFRSLLLLGTTYHARQEDLLGAIGPLEAQSPDVQRVFDPDNGVMVGWDAPLESFRAIACPITIICADRDEFNKPDVSIELFRTLPNAELLIVPDCGHFDLVRNPLVMEAVSSFYRRLP